MKQVETSVTNLDLAKAQGGVNNTGVSCRLTVECPDGYEADEITAEDILHDSQISLVK